MPPGRHMVKNTMERLTHLPCQTKLGCIFFMFHTFLGISISPYALAESKTFIIPSNI